MLRKCLCAALFACALAVPSLSIPSTAQAEPPVGDDKYERVLDYMLDGDWCMYAGRYREAIVWYTRAIQLDERQAVDAYRDRAVCREAIGDRAGARRDIETWVRLTGPSRGRAR